MDKSPLARVPPELRSMIYQHVLRGGLVIGQRGDCHAKERHSDCAKKLVPAQVCKEMRQEFLHVLFTLNPTHVRVLGHYATPGLSNFIAELPNACERALTVIEEMPDSLRSQKTVYVLKARFRASPLFEENLRRVTDDQYALAVKSLENLTQQVRPHSLDICITCAYFSLPYASYLYECVDFPRKGRDLDYFRLRIPINDISESYVILRSSLRQQLLEIEGHSSHQLCSVRHCKVDLTKDLVRTANFFGGLIEKLAVQSSGDGNAAPPKKPAFKLRFNGCQTEVVDVTSDGYRVALDGNYLEPNNSSTFRKRLTYDDTK